MPDVVAEVLHATTDADAVWTEWEMRGTRPDGLPHLMRGVIIFGIADEQIGWARFYLEPVEEGAGGVDAAVGRGRPAAGPVMTAAVRDAWPPMAVIRVMNPILRTVLRTPLGRLVRPFVLLDFAGRRSGRHYRVPAGWHEADGVAFVLSPAPWRANFTDGAPITVHRHGHAKTMTGTLVTDPAVVAQAIRGLLDAGAPPRAVGLDVPRGHAVTADDVVAVHRAMIELRPSPDDHQIGPVADPPLPCVPARTTIDGDRRRVQRSGNRSPHVRGAPT